MKGSYGIKKLYGGAGRGYGSGGRICRISLSFPIGLVGPIKLVCNK